MNIRTLAVLIMFYASSGALADYDINEGRTLLLIVEELDFLIDISNEQSKRPNSGDLVFKYDSLSKDLLRIRELIRFHMENASKQPNQIPHANDLGSPVEGNYTHRKY